MKGLLCVLILSALSAMFAQYPAPTAQPPEPYHIQNDVLALRAMCSHRFASFPQVDGDGRKSRPSSVGAAAGRSGLEPGR